MRPTLLFLALFLVLVTPEEIAPLESSAGVQVNGQSGFTFGDLLLIPRNAPSYGVELFSYNVTDKSFKIVQDLNPGSRNSNPRSFIMMNGAVYFIATVQSGEGLYKMNAQGKVTQACPPFPSQSSPELMVVYQGSLYFTMDHPDVGRELFKYYENTKDWGIVYDIYPGPMDGFPTGAVVFNGLMYFAGSTPTYGRELLSYDGANLTLVVDIALNGASSHPTKPVPFQGKLYFTASVGGTGADLWVYDGNMAVSAKDPLVQAFDSPSQLTVAEGYLYFVPTLGRNRLWRFNGSVYETVLETTSIFSGLRSIKDLNSHQNLHFWTLNSASTSVVEGLWKFESEKKVQTLIASREDVNLFSEIAQSDQTPFVFQNNESIFFAFEDLMLWTLPFSEVVTPPTLTCSECKDLCKQSCQATCKDKCFKKCKTNCQDYLCTPFCSV